MEAFSHLQNLCKVFRKKPIFVREWNKTFSSKTDQVTNHITLTFRHLKTLEIFLLDVFVVWLDQQWPSFVNSEPLTNSELKHLLDIRNAQ